MPTQLIEKPANHSLPMGATTAAASAMLIKSLRSAMASLRTESELSEDDVAKIWGVPPAVISGLETGRYKTFTFRDFYRHVTTCGGAFSIQFNDWNGEPHARIISKEMRDSLQLEISICRHLKQSRGNVRLNKREVAQVMGVSEVTVANIENGAYPLSFYNLHIFVKACGGTIAVEIFNRKGQPVFIYMTQKPAEPPKSLLPRIIAENHVRTVVEFNRAWRHAARDARVANGLNQTEAAKFVKEPRASLARGEVMYAEAGCSLSCGRFHRRILAWEAKAAFVFRKRESGQVTALLIGQDVDSLLAQINKLPDTIIQCFDEAQFQVAALNIFKSRRGELDISQKAVSTRVSIERDKVNKMEKGNYKSRITSNTIFKFVSGLDIDLDVLVADRRGELVTRFTTAQRPDDVATHTVHVTAEAVQP